MRHKGIFSSRFSQDGAPVRYRQRNEVGFTICKNPTGELAPGPLAVGDPYNVDIPVSCPAGSKLLGLHHTHPGGRAYPSKQDIRSARQLRVPYLTIDADGTLRTFRVH